MLYINTACECPPLQAFPEAQPFDVGPVEGCITGNRSPLEHDDEDDVMLLLLLEDEPLFGILSVKLKAFEAIEDPKSRSIPCNKGNNLLDE